MGFYINCDLWGTLRLLALSNGCCYGCFRIKTIVVFLSTVFTTLVVEIAIAVVSGHEAEALFCGWLLEDLLPPVST